MRLTPTAASAAIAGFGFYALVWGIFSKSDTILALFGIRRRYARRGRRWINENKGLTLMSTEVVNFGIHGIKSAEGVTFALGGTLCNFVYIFVINPIICWREQKATPLVESRKIKHESKPWLTVWFGLRKAA